MALITKYSRDHGYAVIFDVSNPQSPVLYVSDTVDITSDIVKLYDATSAAGGVAPAAAHPADARPAAAVPAKK